MWNRSMIWTRSPIFLCFTGPHKWCNWSRLLLTHNPQADPSHRCKHSDTFPPLSLCTCCSVYLAFSSPKSSCGSSPHLLCVNFSTRLTLTIQSTHAADCLPGALTLLYFSSLYLWPPYMLIVFLFIMLIVYYLYLCIWNIIDLMKARIFICFF